MIGHGGWKALSSTARQIIFWLLIIAGALLIYKLVNPGSKNTENIDLTALYQKIDNSELKQLTVKQTETVAIDKATSREYHVQLTNETAKNDLLKEAKEVQASTGKPRVDRVEEEPSNSYMWGALYYLLPFVLIFGFWIFMLRQMQSGGNKALSFGKSRAKLLSNQQKRVTFKDVAGVEEAKEELQEIIEFLKEPQKFQKLGGRIPKGVLMMGPPGTGKTLLARAIAGEAGVPFFSISGSDFVEMFVGVGASRVRDLFEQGKKHAPCIIFIDEIDAVGRHRGAGLGGGHDEREQTLNQLLVEMDGFESNEGVIIIAATNRPDVLDPAILRPGRFDRRITVPRPDIRGREGILAVHTKKVPLSGDVDLNILAAGTPGFVGADLENLVNEAALLAARQDKEAVTMEDFELAKDKVLMGTERRSMVMSEEERRTAAWHEAGHTLVGKLVEGNDAVHKVSIIPRGAALGVTMFLPTEDRHLMTSGQTKARIAMALGGRVAEEIVFNEITTGAQDDIKRATRLARAMVCELGMTKRLGPVAYGANEESGFLGREMTSRREDYSETTATEIDQEVRSIVDEQYAIASKVLSANRDTLDALATALLERETLDAQEIEAVLAGRDLPPRQRAIIPTWSEKRKDKTEKRRPASIFGAPKPATSGT